MVYCMVGGGIDDGAIQKVRSIVDHDGPCIDKDEQRQKQETVHRDDIEKHMVWNCLRGAVDWVERVRRKRRRHFPQVVRLVDGRVNQRVVEISVDPVDCHVGEEKEQDDAEEKIGPPVVFHISIGL